MPSKWSSTRSRVLAWQFLYDLFDTHYRPIPAAWIFRAARRAGLQESTIRRAKAQLDIRALQVYKEGRNEWLWLPPFMSIAEGVPEEWEIQDPPPIRADTDLAEYGETCRLLMPSVGSIESYRLIEEVLNEEFEARERWSRDVWRRLAFAGPLQTVGVNYPGCLSAKLNARRLRELKNPILPKPFSKEFPIDEMTEARILRAAHEWNDRYRQDDYLLRVIHRLWQLHETTADWSLLEKQMHWLAKAPEVALLLPLPPTLSSCGDGLLEPASAGSVQPALAPRGLPPVTASLQPGVI